MRQLETEAFTKAFIDTLTRFQAGILEAASDEEPFIVLEVVNGTDHDYADYSETMQLIDFGFLEDVSEKYRELVDNARATYRRGFKVLIATPTGVKMFGGISKRSVN